MGVNRQYNWWGVWKLEFGLVAWSAVVIKGGKMEMRGIDPLAPRMRN